MRIQIEHHFEGASLAEVERLYLFDNAFNRATFHALGYERRVTRLDQTDSVLTRELCLAPEKPLPPPFRALVPDGMFNIQEQLQYDLRAHEGSWRTVPSALATQFAAAGTLSLRAERGAVVFTMRGDVNARIPLLSRIAEKQALKTAEQQHAALAEAIRQKLGVNRVRAA